MRINSQPNAFFTRQARYENIGNSAAEISFDDILKANANAKSGDEIKIPAKWTHSTDWASCDMEALNNVKAFFYSQELSMNERTPTYEVTDEQREWLSARHRTLNFEEIAAHSNEEANLFADMVYLNILSYDDVRKRGEVIAKPQDGVKRVTDGVVDGAFPSALYGYFGSGLGENDGYFSGSLSDYLLNSIAKIKGDIGSCSEHDDMIRQYVDSAERFVSHKQKIFDVLQSLDK